MREHRKVQRVAESVDNEGRGAGQPMVKCDHPGIGLLLGETEEWLKLASSYLVVESERCKLELNSQERSCPQSQITFDCRPMMCTPTNLCMLLPVCFS